MWYPSFSRLIPHIGTRPMATLTELLRNGRYGKWKRPKCENGCPKMWGHGFVSRYYEPLDFAVCLKRWRCPTCGRVVTMLPVDFYRRYRSCVNTIYRALKHRLGHGRWPPRTIRQRAGHWLRKFMAKAQMDFPDGKLTELLDWLHHKGIPILF